MDIFGNLFGMIVNLTKAPIAPVFNFYGGVTKEEAVEAGRVSFAEFKRLVERYKAEERRKNLSASTR